METLEKVTLANPFLELEVLPEFGGKISSFRYIPSKTELMQMPLARYAPRTMTMDFDESDASGFDECLPSIAPCNITTDGASIDIPDHGDFWRIPWHCEISHDEIHLSSTGISLPFQFDKVLRLCGSNLEIAYRLTNIGTKPWPYIWAAHPLFAINEGDRIVLPDSVKAVRVESSIGNRLEPGSTLSWPRSRTPDGGEADFSLAKHMNARTGDMFFTKAPLEGWAALERVREGLRIEVQFGLEQARYLGLWLCYGGWPEGRTARQQCIAIEPCTASTGTLAEAIARGEALTLVPGALASWNLEIGVSRMNVSNAPMGKDDDATVPWHRKNEDEFN